MTKHCFQLDKSPDVAGPNYGDLFECIGTRLPGAKLGFESHRPKRAKDHLGFTSRDPQGNEISVILMATVTLPPELRLSRDETRHVLEECLQSIGYEHVEVLPD